MEEVNVKFKEEKRKQKGGTERRKYVKKEKNNGRKNEKKYGRKRNEKNKEHVRHASTVAAALYRD